MEKNLNKYIKLEEATKRAYLTVELIQMLCSRRFIPYFQDKDDVLVNPEDIEEYLKDKIMGPLYKMKMIKRKKETKPETPQEEEQESKNNTP